MRDDTKMVDACSRWAKKKVHVISYEHHDKNSRYSYSFYSSTMLELGRKRVSSQRPTLNASIDSKQTPGTVARVPQMHHNCHVIWSSRVPRAHASRWMYVNIFACVGRIRVRKEMERGGDFSWLPPLFLAELILSSSQRGIVAPLKLRLHCREFLPRRPTSPTFHTEPRQRTRVILRALFKFPPFGSASLNPQFPVSHFRL